MMTWNMYRGNNGLDKVGDLIREQYPDVVFLQEVLRPQHAPTGRDQADDIARRIGGMKVYSVTSLRAGNEHRWGDPAILSKWPLKNARFIDAGDGGRAYALLATLDAPGRPLHFLCVHANGTFKLAPRHILETAIARRKQIEHLLRIVDGLQGDVVIAGDFNTPEWMPEYRWMRESWVDFGMSGEPSLFTHSAERPIVRIDYVFGRGEFEAGKYEVISTTASDHRPVVVELVIRRGATSRPQDRRYDGLPSTSE